MKKQREEWVFFDEDLDDWIKEPVSKQELAKLHEAGRINDYTELFNVRTMPAGPGIGHRGILYCNLGKFEDFDFDPEPITFIQNRRCSKTTVLSGPNNGGKTFFLK